MAEPEEDPVARFSAIAESAAPGSAQGDHVSTDELRRIRDDGEAPELDSAHRHLSTCAACRARLLEASQESSAATSASSARAWGRIETPRGRPRPLAWAAAAIVVVGVAAAVTARNRVPEELAIARRSYAGMMGPRSAAPPNENANVELSFAADPALSAFVLPTSDAGRLLARPHWFRRESSGRAVAVLAPRTFSSESGPVFALIVWGREPAVREVAAQLGGLALETSLARTERALAELARKHGARVQRLPLASP